jgi:hypothetical protein
MFEKLSRAMRGNQNARKRLAVGGALAGGAAYAAKNTLISGLKKSANKYDLLHAADDVRIMDAVKDLNTNISKSIKATNMLNAANITVASQKRVNNAVRITTNKLNMAAAKLRVAEDIKIANKENAAAAVKMARKLAKHSKVIVGGAALIGGIAAQRS